MNNDEKILQALEILHVGQQQQAKAIASLQADMTIIKEDVKTVDWKVEAFNTKLDGIKEALIQGQEDIIDQIRSIITAAALQKHVDKLEDRVKALEAELANVKAKN